MNTNSFNPWLHRFAVLTAVTTLGLVCVGGMVTSKGAGMAVPDWPTSYGYNMFALPFHYWKGGVLFEHSHRLLASGVGLLTTILAIWIWFADSRRWLRWLGVIAFLAVVVQGVLGGLRVVLFKDQIGIFHATLAQLFFALLCAIALFTSRWWSAESKTEITPGMRRHVVATTVMIFLQLVIASTMRHQHAGLAIPDFPLAYGKVWPDMSEAAVQHYNQVRLETAGENAITAFQVGLQMAHRIVAVLIFLAVAGFAFRAEEKVFRRLGFAWLGLILIQIALGAWTIWSNKAADVATAHVMVGALSLVTGALGCIISYRRSDGNTSRAIVESPEAPTTRAVSV